MIHIQTFVLGPLENNTYLLADPQEKLAVLVDPSFGSQVVRRTLADHGWTLSQIWLTHAHFDHFAGTHLFPDVSVALHPADYPLWDDGGGSKFFGQKINHGTRPSLNLTPEMKLQVGSIPVEVRHTPGHSRGHVVFYIPSASTCLTGDLIFAGSVGRTDLPGGDMADLLTSIQTQILTLPPATRLLCGHGDETSVEFERDNNPFLE